MLTTSAENKEQTLMMLEKGGTIAWRSPSNIALIKYWGKKGFQLPANPSISFTLGKAHTETSLSYVMNDGAGGLVLEFLFEGKENPAFGAKVQKYLDYLSNEELPFLKTLKIRIETGNSFPHSAGIASSASGMSALALCLTSLEGVAVDRKMEREEFLQRASYLARIGSGSAARSVYGGLVSWGETTVIPGSSDLFGSPYTGAVHDIFREYRDTVLIISKAKKNTSSTTGHQLMNEHPYAKARYAQAENNLTNLLKALAEGDTAAFGDIVENEALSLHGLMMTSQPSVVLTKPATWEVIQRVRHFRELNNIPLHFTLDAGPNVHLLYPKQAKTAVETFINEELVVYCDGKSLIADNVGRGPEKL